MFHKQEKITIKVDGMSCAHCANKVITALKSIDGIKKVKVDLDKKQVMIISNKKIEEKPIKEIIEKLEYIYLGIVES